MSTPRVSTKPSSTPGPPRSS